MKNVKQKNVLKTGTLLAVIIIFSIFSFVPAHANTAVQLSDQNVIAGQTFLIYEVQAGGLILLGEYNTTDLVSLNDSSQYVFVLKPSTIDYIHNPLALFDLFVNSVPAWIVVFAALAVVGLGFVLVRMGGRR